MTDAISIGTQMMPGVIYNRLSDELAFLQKEGFLLNIDVDKKGNFTFLDCQVFKKNGQIDKEALETIKLYISHCLADTIIDEWENRIIKRAVRENYYYYNEEDRKLILNKAREILNPIQLNMYQKKQRKQKIMEKILEYLDVHQELILEGFVNFRLKDYQDELKEIVNTAVDEFLLEKEYMEFIRLLKYFVEIQEPRIDQIKIVFKEQGKFSLLDMDNKPLQHECLDGLMLDVLENGINYDDLLVSSLITLAPKQIELHFMEGFEKTDTVKMIKQVFGDRVIQCKGCTICQNPRS